MLVCLCCCWCTTVSYMLWFQFVFVWLRASIVFCVSFQVELLKLLESQQELTQ